MKRVMSLLLPIALILSLAACGEVAAPAAPGTTPASAATPAPSPEPTPDPIAARAAEILADMTEEEKLCQLMIVKPEALTGEDSVTESGEMMAQALEKWPVGGIIYSLDNLVTVDQTKAMIDGAQDLCKLKLFICADEEGGNVGRLMYKLGTTYFHDMFTYREEGTPTAYSNAKTIATDMVGCHFNTDFAPVADVWTNPDNTVIGTRAYSDDFGEAAELVSAAVKGFRDGGVICCVKHFPGHGDTAADSHDGPVTSNRTLDELRAGEFLPFVSGMEAGADMVMIGHINVPAVDDAMPASMSHVIVTDILRGELGWDGVVVTDGLEMGALSAYTDAQKCVNCLSAGCDILLGAEDIPGALTGMQQALSDGTLTMQRVDESVLRILTLKLTRGIID